MVYLFHSEIKVQIWIYFFIIQCGFIKFVKFDHWFEKSVIHTSISASIERYRERCSSSLSDFSENVAREIERASVQPWMPIAWDSKYRRRLNFSTMGSSEWNGKFLKIATRRCQSWHIPLYRSVVGMWPESRGRAWHTSVANPALRRLYANFIGQIVRSSCELSCETGTWRSSFTSTNSQARVGNARVGCLLSAVAGAQPWHQNSTKVRRYAFRKAHKGRTNPCWRLKAESFPWTCMNLLHSW